MMMRTTLSARRGQSMGEYAILFAIVLGAAIAMQQYIKARLQGAVAQGANDYFNSVGNGVLTFEPNRDTKSSSTTNLNFATARKGNVNIDSTSNTNVTKGSD